MSRSEQIELIGSHQGVDLFSTGVGRAFDKTATLKKGDCSSMDGLKIKIYSDTNSGNAVVLPVDPSEYPYYR